MRAMFDNGEKNDSASLPNRHSRRAHAKNCGSSSIGDSYSSVEGGRDNFSKSAAKVSTHNGHMRASIYQCTDTNIVDSNVQKVPVRC